MNVAECCGSFLQSQITEFLSKIAISEVITQVKMLRAFYLSKCWEHFILMEAGGFLWHKTF